MPRYFMTSLLRLRPPRAGGSHRGRRSRGRILDTDSGTFSRGGITVVVAGRGDLVRCGDLVGLGDPVGVRLAHGVVARAAHPHGDPRAQRLVTPYDCLDRLSADGTDVFVAVH